MKDLKKNVLELYNTGLKQKEISERLDVEYSVVARIVKTEQSRIHRANNLEQVQKQAHASYIRNRKKVNERAAKRYEEEKDEINAKLKEDRKKNPKKWFEIRKKYRERNPKHVKDLRNKNYAKHKEKNRPRVNKAALERQRKRKLFVYTKYSNGIPECTCCGITGLEFLTIDHIIPKRKMENDPKMIKIGFKSTRKAGALNQWLVTNNFPKGFQILCWNCNFAKGILGKCPHKN